MPVSAGAGGRVFLPALWGLGRHISWLVHGQPWTRRGWLCPPTPLQPGHCPGPQPLTRHCWGLCWHGAWPAADRPRHRPARVSRNRPDSGRIKITSFLFQHLRVFPLSGGKKQNNPKKRNESCSVCNLPECGFSEASSWRWGWPSYPPVLLRVVSLCVLCV